MLRHTRRQLLDCARYLGLTGIHRLTKDALATQFLQALQRLAPLQAAERRSPRTSTQVRSRARRRSGGRAEDIPWGYGQDRVTAMVVDPDRLYVYWEVTDEALERARAGLGPGGRDAWLNLRVYDVTNRIFDGTNAHGYFDHSVSRTDRQWFFLIGRPTSTAVVEVGLKSHGGLLRPCRAVRSGGLPAPGAGVSRRRGMAHGAHRPAARSASRPSTTAGPAVVPAARRADRQAEPVRVWDIRRTHAGWDGEWIDPRRELRDRRGEEWVEWVAAHDRVGRTGHPHHLGSRPVLTTRWSRARYVEERFEGTVTVRSVNGTTHVVHGPWQVVIRGSGREPSGESWPSGRSAARGSPTTGVAVRTVGAAGTPGGSEQVVLGASELRWRAASELRLGGASEIYLPRRERAPVSRGERDALRRRERVARARGERTCATSEPANGASGGASETRYAGASERLYPAPASAPGRREREPSSLSAPSRHERTG